MRHFLSQMVKPMPGSIRYDLSDREWGRASVAAFWSFIVVFPTARWAFDLLRLPNGSTAAPVLAFFASVAGFFGMLVFQYRQGMSRSAIPSSRIPTLLLVEDNESLGPLLRRRLEAEGWTVHLARSRAEALQLLATRPNVALLDLMLPDGAGEEILQEIRYRGFKCRVVVMSAIDDPERRESVAALGADDFAPKDGDFDAIRRLIGHPSQYQHPETNR